MNSLDHLFIVLNVYIYIFFFFLKKKGTPGLCLHLQPSLTRLNDQTYFFFSTFSVTFWMLLMDMQHVYLIKVLYNHSTIQVIQKKIKNKIALMSDKMQYIFCLTLPTS